MDELALDDASGENAREGNTEHQPSAVRDDVVQCDLCFKSPTMNLRFLDGFRFQSFFNFGAMGSDRQ